MARCPFLAPATPLLLGTAQILCPPACCSWPKPTATSPPELSMSCTQLLGLGTHRGLKQHMALTHSPAGTASHSQHRATQQVKHHRGASDGLGQGPQPAWTHSASPWQTFPGRDRTLSPVGKGTGSPQPATGSTVNAELWFAQGVGLKLVLLPDLLLCSNEQICGSTSYWQWTFEHGVPEEKYHENMVQNAAQKRTLPKNMCLKYFIGATPPAHTFCWLRREAGTPCVCWSPTTMSADHSWNRQVT